AEASADARKTAPTEARRAPVAAPRPPPAAIPPPATPIRPRKLESAPEENEIYPEAGDLVDHFAFGRALVLKSDGDELVVQNEASGRTRALRLGALHAAPPTDDNGKRLFRLSQRRPT